MNERRFWYVVVALAIACILIVWGFAQIKSQGNATAKNGHRTAMVAQQTKTLAQQQERDREADVLKNVEARKSDCENNNQIRKALRENVIVGSRETPLLLKVLPQLDTKEILADAKASDERQLREYAPLDCEEYAQRALPGPERVKVTLQEQQIELQRIVRESADARVKTVKQRCELTSILLEQPRSAYPTRRLRKSYAGCEAQLAEVERIAREAG